MTIRPATAADLADLEDIDGTIESNDYAHVDHASAEAGGSWKVEWRAARQKLIVSLPLDDGTRFTLRQVLSGNDEGVAIAVEHDGAIVALLLAQQDASRGVMDVLDLRVDYDVRRQGIATVLLYNLIEQARGADLRAVYMATRTNNAPAGKLLEKLGWELSGLDTKRYDNHDLVKESATLFWYYVIK